MWKRNVWTSTPVDWMTFESLGKYLGIRIYCCSGSFAAPYTINSYDHGLAIQDSHIVHRSNDPLPHPFNQPVLLFPFFWRFVWFLQSQLR